LFADVVSSAENQSTTDDRADCESDVIVVQIRRRRATTSASDQPSVSQCRAQCIVIVVSHLCLTHYHSPPYYVQAPGAYLDEAELAPPL